MQGDGFSLSKAKKFGPQYRNDIPKLIELWDKDRTVEKLYSWFTPAKEIIENDYILSANAYNPNIGEGEKKYREPKEILEDIEKLRREVEAQLTKVTRLI